MAATSSPQLPVPLAELPGYIAERPHQPVAELIEPYRKHEAQLRQMYSQDPNHELLKDPYANVLPLFADGTPEVKIQARNLAAESKDEKSKYIMPLPDHIRRATGSPATVQSLKEFQRNFALFSESSLVDIDWSNVVAAGSSVVNCLLPVPKEYSTSKKALREFYHQKFCPASDVDLFLYGLTEEEAVKKIAEIESKIRDSLLTEVTTVRTKNAVTICSQYPTRHVQIVLRIYKSVSEILTGFDVDCSGAAYSGDQVYCTPRALQSYITQINHIDLSRRSPSYENRLSKYGHRGFEVYWGSLDRSRVDPTIFERSFRRTLGLARLLVLERLPTSASRDDYVQKRREERGRPVVNTYRRQLGSLIGNIKDAHEDEVAEWESEEAATISNYNTFTIPYGPRFNAKKIEKLCYTRDLLLNAQWNQPDDRKVYLHRHPAFFGRFEDVAEDCCGFCPKPETDAEKEIAEDEAKTFVSGRISFLKDDPGRQQIGSFNPLTDDDWTEMGYIGNTARLCLAIADGDAEAVEDWLAQDGSDPNTRDHTGRTPLHLAVMTSTPEIVRLLVDAGARLIARIADGRTALHLAAQRGDIEIIKILMNKSNANEAEEDEKVNRRRRLSVDTPMRDADDPNPAENESSDSDEDSDSDSDGEMVDDDESEDEARSFATGSFVKVKSKKKSSGAEDPLNDGTEDNNDEPDFYDINALSWDVPCSALHYAIFSGHDAVVKLLCQEYGADVLLPVAGGSRDVPGLTLVLALALPHQKAKSMAETLLSLGATSAQGDTHGFTAFHRYIQFNDESMVDLLCDNDATGVGAALNTVSFSHFSNDAAESPIQAAVESGNMSLTRKLLARGAAVEIGFELWLKSAKKFYKQYLNAYDYNKGIHTTTTRQPLILALSSTNPSIAIELIERGADVNVLTTAAYDRLKNTYRRTTGESALDVVRSNLVKLRGYKREGSQPKLPETALPAGMNRFLEQFRPGSYAHRMVERDIKAIWTKHDRRVRLHDEEQTWVTSRVGIQEKEELIKSLIDTLEKVEKLMLEKGAKTFKELHPEIQETAPFRTIPPETFTSTYNYDFTFGLVNDLTEPRRAAYMRLFEAAWDGDLATIKSLTLASWDGHGREAPLQMAATDKFRRTPFSIAVIRGHLEVAKEILEIARLQYSPKTKDKTRYRMDMGDNSDSDSDNGSDSESESGDDPRSLIYPEVVNRRVTVENVGHVSLAVKSPFKPRNFFLFSFGEYLEGERTETTVSPFRFAIQNNDLKVLRFLLDCAEHFCSETADDEKDGEDGVFSFPADDFKFAIQRGKPELLVEIIRRTGAGLPLETLVKNSGIELEEKPEFYQGLTVYGKKRSDWVAEGRRTTTRRTGIDISPLIVAAMAGSIESVEWFMSDAPLRHYLDFSRSAAAERDARMKHLAQSPGGLESAVRGWIKEQSELLLHAAILGHPGDKTNTLIEYLIRTFPASIETKSRNGATPLFLASYLGRTDIVKMLVGAGADQTCRNVLGENILHAALANYPRAKELAGLLDALNPAHVSRMFTERSGAVMARRTPLHQWLYGTCRPLGYRYNYAGPYDDGVRQPAAVLKLLIQRTGDGGRAALEMLDGAGHTPLHDLASSGGVGLMGPRLLRTLFDVVGDLGALLRREDAVGRTPAEVARECFVAGRTDRTETRCDTHSFGDPVRVLVDCRAEVFDPEGAAKRRDALDDDDDRDPGRKDETFNADEYCRHFNHSTGRSGCLILRDAAQHIWEMFADRAARYPGGRRLVSLNEANDVARPLFGKHVGARYAFKVDEPAVTVPDKEIEKCDIIDDRWRSPPHPAWRRTNHRSGEEPRFCLYCGITHC